MTEEESRLIKGEAVEKLSELRRHSTCLVAKAEKHVATISQGRDYVTHLIGDASFMSARLSRRLTRRQQLKEMGGAVAPPKSLGGYP